MPKEFRKKAGRVKFSLRPRNELKARTSTSHQDQTYPWDLSSGKRLRGEVRSARSIITFKIRKARMESHPIRRKRKGGNRRKGSNSGKSSRNTDQGGGLRL